MEILNRIDEVFNGLRKELTEFAVSNLDKAVIVSKDQYTAKVRIDNIVIELWVGHGKGYYVYRFGQLDFTFHSIEGFDYSTLKEFVESRPAQENRSIKQSQLSNDLFFSFDGVYGKVERSGYNDDDWRTKYKPMQIKDGEVTRDINYNTMQATYKGKTV